LKSEKQEKSKLMTAEIAYVKAQHGITLEEIDTDIEQIKSRQALNRKLTSEFGSADTTSGVQNPQQAKLKSLEQQKEKHLRAMEIKIEDIKQESSSDQNLLANQIRLLEHEHKLLLEEQKKLNKYATADGVVENVYVKAGEQVAAFTPLLSVNPLRPSTVVGYLVGKKVSVPEIGSTVEISAYDKRTTTVSGKVIGFGAVTELPEILQKSTAVKGIRSRSFY
jgi:HlyD family secretion protein